jgi:hypothetical protein
MVTAGLLGVYDTVISQHHEVSAVAFVSADDAWPGDPVAGVD